MVSSEESGKAVSDLNENVLDTLSDSRVLAP